MSASCPADCANGCKQCPDDSVRKERRREYMQRYRAANPEKFREAARRSREANRERRREYDRRYMLRHYAANPEKQRERSRRYHAANRDKVLEYKRRYNEVNRDKRRRYREVNLEKFRKASRRWRAANPEASRKQSHRWQKANPDKVRALSRTNNHRRRAIKKAAPSVNFPEPPFTGVCYICLEAITKEQAHLDHIHPLAKGGAHEPNNVAWACATCNRSKHANLLDPRAFAWGAVC